MTVQGGSLAQISPDSMHDEESLLRKVLGRKSTAFLANEKVVQDGGNPSAGAGEHDQQRDPRRTDVLTADGASRG